MKKLAIITTHPIQYNAPLFKLLSKNDKVRIKVFYTWGQAVLEKKYDPGFNKTIEWDIPLLEGYEYEFLENTAKKKGSHHFNGIINPGIIQRLNDWSPDAILVFGWNFSSHLKVMRYFKNKIPVFFRGDSTMLDEKKNIPGLLKKIALKWVYTHINEAFYCGTQNKSYFLYYGLSNDQLIAAFHAIDNSRFDNSDGKYTSKAQEMRRKLGIENEDLVFLYAGKLLNGKNIELLINAFTKLNDTGAQLVIAGNGPVESTLKSNSIGLKNLHFLDFQNQQAMPVLYQVCDVFVLPSGGETWGLSVNEAMAAGRAVIVSDRCGCAIDLVEDGANGYVFRSGDMDDLSSKMEICIRNKQNVRLMQQRAVERIRDFTFDAVAGAIEKEVVNNA